MEVLHRVAADKAAGPCDDDKIAAVWLPSVSAQSFVFHFRSIKDTSVRL